MPRGVLDLIGLAATLVFALPVAALGLEFVVQGRPLGYALLVSAGLMIIFGEYVTGPTDVPETLAQRIVGHVVPDDPEADRQESE